MKVRAGRARLTSDTVLAGWASLIGPPRPESAHSRRLARIGGVASLTALVLYVGWRIGFTMPAGGPDLVAAIVFVFFEAVPIIGLALRVSTLWTIDCTGPAPVSETRPGNRVVVMIPTYNEPVEVIAPTIAAACALQPAHQTWVLDDGDRAWVADMCASYGARYVRRDVHDHAKAGNMNHALALMEAEEQAGAEPLDIIAVLDCDHVPLPTFLTATLGWFDDPEIALVQGPQTYYNAGAYDDDGETGEQGVFFHVLLPSRASEGAGPFWCGSTSLIRTRALREIGGIATDTIVEDMHTTLGLLKAGWRTAYHHQTLALGLAPDTPDQYLLQRRRWGLGCMQVLAKEHLWAPKSWLSRRNYYEYFTGVMWWLEGVATVCAFAIPAVVLISGAQISTANPILFVGVFIAMFMIRLWGAKQMFRRHLHWPTAFALRILRIPIGLSCLWWLLTRRTLTFQVTPKSGADDRVRGRAPRILYWLIGMNIAVLLYAMLGLTGTVPWRVSPATTGGSGLWLALSCFVLIMGVRRIQSAEFATSRRNAYRVPLRAPVTVDDRSGELVDVSTGGAAVRSDQPWPTDVADGLATVDLLLPGAADAVRMRSVRARSATDGSEVASLRVGDRDWASHSALSLWLFHTPAGAVSGLPPGTPAVAALDPSRRRPASVLARQRGADPELVATPPPEPQRA